MITCGPVELVDEVKLIKSAVDDDLCKSFTPNLIGDVVKLAKKSGAYLVNVRLTRGGQVSAYYDSETDSYVIEVDPNLAAKLDDVEALRNDVAVTLTENEMIVTSTQGLGKSIVMPYFPRFYEEALNLLRELKDGVSLEVRLVDDVDIRLEVVKQSEGFSVYVLLKKDYLNNVTKVLGNTITYLNALLEAIS